MNAYRLHLSGEVSAHLDDEGETCSPMVCRLCLQSISKRQSRVSALKGKSQDPEHIYLLIFFFLLNHVFKFIMAERERKKILTPKMYNNNNLKKDILGDNFTVYCLHILQHIDYCTYMSRGTLNISLL